MCENEYEYLVKLLMIGGEGAGKTQLLSRFADDTFSDSYIPTTALEFKIRTIDIDGKIVRVQVWEKGGSERFRTMHKNYYRGVHAIGICFDLCDANEFETVSRWRQEVDRYARENIPVFIIGTKCERFNLLYVDFETIRNFCLSHEVQYFECSSKLNINVEDLFESMARKVVELEEKAKQERETPNTILVRKEKPKKNCAFQ